MFLLVVVPFFIIVYPLLAFLLQNFDRWVQDFYRGNYAVFKQRYAKLWGATSFYDHVVDALEVLPHFGVDEGSSEGLGTGATGTGVKNYTPQRDGTSFAGTFFDTSYAVLLAR